mmetsp:Transcript_37164/g.80907  ORF Transcript_37164/g.80907 Transcript_37164/m.80907 type:complete len:311 (-) Transcript_37164:367-1299(-)
MEVAAKPDCAPSLRNVEYHDSDFDFEDWRIDVEAQGLCAASSVEETTDWDTQSQAWERFHQQHNRGVFFKERRYLLVEFPELSSSMTRGTRTSVLEIGCGSGSSVLPLLKANPDLNVHACDFSRQAVSTAKQSVDALAMPPHRSCLFVCDVATQAVGTCLGAALQDAGAAVGPTSEAPSQAPSQVDHLLLVFVVSAVAPADMAAFMRNAAGALKPGGCVLFRDYGLYDLTMLRFPPSQRRAERLYERQDGTLSYFFTKEAVEELCAAAGLVLVECSYCCVQLVNRKNGKPMRRVFVHAKMMKPHEAASPS